VDPDHPRPVMVRLPGALRLRAVCLQRRLEDRRRLHDVREIVTEAWSRSRTARCSTTRQLARLSARTARRRGRWSSAGTCNSARWSSRSPSRPSGSSRTSTSSTSSSAATRWARSNARRRRLHRTGPRHVRPTLLEARRDTGPAGRHELLSSTRTAHGASAACYPDRLGQDQCAVCWPSLGFRMS
jgi:hypothetical protein